MLLPDPDLRRALALRFRYHPPMRRRLFTLLSALSLLMCVVLALASFRESIAVAWKGHAAGVNRGVALFGRVNPRYHDLAVVRERASVFPGPSFVGFRYISLGPTKIIGVPLWFPSAIALTIFIRSWRRPRRVVGFPIETKIPAASPPTN
jgi:integral membrane sensor domain MASE1